MRTCTRCVLPETYPNITFDSQGVCNFCNAHVAQKHWGKEALVKSIEKFCDPTCGYDAIIGLSGGRDSTYTAHYVVRELGYKVIAFTYDNGFIPQTTWENIQNTVEILGIDHRVISSKKIDKTVKSVLNGISKAPSPAMVAFLCTGCYTGIIEGYAQLVEELNCRLVIKGGGEPEMSFAEYLLSGSQEHDKLSLAKGFLRELKQNPYYLRPDVTFPFFQEYLSRFTHHKTDYASIYLFKYIAWDEQKILDTITRELKWRIPDKMSSSWRSDCKVNVIRQFLYKELLGFTKNEELLSQLIRAGVLTREDAISRLVKENQTDPELLAEILADIDFPVKKLYYALEKMPNRG